MESIACRSGMQGSTSAGQVMQKCTSSSTAPLHNLHILCSAGMPTYLPVSISSGAVPPLSRATTDRCALQRTVLLVIFAMYLFSRFSRVKSHSRKLKPRKFCCPRVKRTNCVSIPGLLLYGSIQKRVSERAFDGYHWSNPKTQTHDPDSGARPRAEAIAAGPRFTDRKN